MTIVWVLFAFAGGCGLASCALGIGEVARELRAIRELMERRP